MVIANLLGISILLYLLWNRLKADYHYEKIFNFGFTFLISLLTCYLVSISFLPSLAFWTTLVVAVVTLNLVSRYLKMNVYEVFEGLVISMLPWLALIYLEDTVKNLHASSFAGFWIMLFCIFIFFYLKSIYRTFSWYKSGRVGFSGLVTCIIYFILRIIFLKFFPDMIFISPVYDLYFSLGVTLLILILLYNLGKVKS